jgi:hypothetical protein
MGNTDSPSRQRSARRFPVAGLRPIEPGDSDDHWDDRRWPPWLSILFILLSSLALWALIIRAGWWWIGPV